MERKILKKLKDTARGKASVQPVRANGAARTAKKVYSTSQNQRQLRSATGGRVSKTSGTGIKQINSESFVSDNN